MIILLLAIAAGGILVERLWPASQLPRAHAWGPRIALVNIIQIGIVIIAGHAWDRWFARVSLLHISNWAHDLAAAVIAYFISTFVYYWWHRFRHESQFFWRLCHQLHHSPRRIELLTSFYKHPVEILLNSLLTGAIVYPLLGCNAQAAAIYMALITVAEYFYHWNIRTPRWLGWLIHRPASHPVHHE